MVEQFSNMKLNFFGVHFFFRTTGSLLHLLKSSLGTGILAMPMAFKNSGLLFGGIGTLVVGFLCTHAVHILVCNVIFKLNKKTV